MARPRRLLTLAFVALMVVLGVPGTSGAQVETVNQSALGCPVGGVAADNPGLSSVRVGGALRPPAKVYNENPMYPDDARTLGVQGVVIIEALIGVDGAVHDACVLRSIPLLDQAAIDAVTQWRFEPVYLNGVPQAVMMTVTVNFTLPREDPR